MLDIGIPLTANIDAMADFSGTQVHSQLAYLEPELASSALILMWAA
jgi:hypothetical protein